MACRRSKILLKSNVENSALFISESLKDPYFENEVHRSELQKLIARKFPSQVRSCPLSLTGISIPLEKVSYFEKLSGRYLIIPLVDIFSQCRHNLLKKYSDLTTWSLCKGQPESDVIRLTKSSSDVPVVVKNVRSHKMQGNEITGFTQYLRRSDQAEEDKSKDFVDDATMEHVRHNLFRLSSVDGMVSGGPPSAITFHSSVIGRRIDGSGKVNILLRWDPEDMVPDTWIAEKDFLSNLEKTIPVSELPLEALQSPLLDILGTAGILPRPGKRKRK